MNAKTVTQTETSQECELYKVAKMHNFTKMLDGKIVCAYCLKEPEDGIIPKVKEETE
jgi:hypothetical protein